MQTQTIETNMADLFLFYAQNSILFFYDQFVYYNSLRYGVQRPPIEMIYKCFFFLVFKLYFQYDTGVCVESTMHPRQQQRSNGSQTKQNEFLLTASRSRSRPLILLCIAMPARTLLLVVGVVFQFCAQHICGRARPPHASIRLHIL